MCTPAGTGGGGGSVEPPAMRQQRPGSHGGPGKSLHGRRNQDPEKLDDKCSGAYKHTQNLLMDGVSNFFFL